MDDFEDNYYSDVIAFEDEYPEEAEKEQIKEIIYYDDYDF